MFPNGGHNVLISHHNLIGRFRPGESPDLPLHALQILRKNFSIRNAADIKSGRQQHYRVQQMHVAVNQARIDMSACQGDNPGPLRLLRRGVQHLNPPVFHQHRGGDRLLRLHCMNQSVGKKNRSHHITLPMAIST